MNTTTDDRPRRWATRREAIEYAKVGATTMNQLMRDRRIHAKKLGAKKVLIDLNSIDDYYGNLPDVGSIRSEGAPQSAR